MNSVACLLSVVMVASVLPGGDALKCYSSSCSNTTMPGSPTVTRRCDEAQREITCPLGSDRCMTMRSKMKMSGMTIDAEMRNCTMSLMCNPKTFCEGANATGAAVECQVGCCEGDLCNSGGPITTQVPPTGGGPSGADLSCYSCASANFKLPGVDMPEADCKNPAKQTCGPDFIPGTKQNRCIRITAKKGDSEYELRNCSGAYFCNAATACAMANQTGELTGCSISCCQGNLCNKDTAPSSKSPSTKPPSPEGGSTSLTGTLTCVLVMFTGAIVLLADMI